MSRVREAVFGWEKKRKEISGGAANAGSKSFCSWSGRLVVILSEAGSQRR